MFIEITLSDGTKSLLNKNHIVRVWEEDETNHNAAIETILDIEGSCYYVKEYYEEIKQLLND